MAITPRQLAAISELLQPPGREQMPWERLTTTPAYDMFGSTEDDPMVRRSRELEFDRANAGAELQARVADRRPWETVEDIATEVNLKYGLQPPGSANRLPPLVKAGSTVLTPNAQGELEVAYQEPERERRTTYRVPFKTDLMGDISEYVSMTEDEIVQGIAEGTLPEAARNSEVVKFIAGRGGRATEPVPTPRRSIGFIGAPGGMNLFDNPFERGLGRTQDSTSKKLTREIATDFLRRANGDKNAARRMAREAGYAP